MARARVIIDSKPYKVLSWTASQRPSQAADPAALVIAEWKIDSPMGSSYEDISEGFGGLGIDYTDNTDSRWQNTLTLGPLANSVTLSTKDTTWTTKVMDSTHVLDSHVPDAGPAAGNITGFALMEGAGTVYLYVLRGRYVTKVDVSDFTVKETHVLPEAGTSILATTTATGVREVSVGMPTHAYQVMNSIATPPNNDNWVVNADNVVCRILGAGNDRIVGAGKDNLGIGNVVAGNVLTGAVTMADPAWNDIASIPGSVTVTGFGLDGPFYVVMTDEGPYMLDEEKREFFQLVPEIPRSTENRVVGNWSFLGTLLGLATGARYSRFGSGESYGLENFRLNTSVVQGFMTGQAASARWSYEAWYNEVEADTTIIAWRNRLMGDGHAYSVLSPFPLVSVANARVNAIANIDTASGKRTNPTLVYGEGASTLRYLTLGRQAREISDSNYRFASTGTAYLTEMKRYPGMIKQLQAVEFETADAAAGKTVTFGVSVDGAAAVTLTAVATNGWQRLLFVDGSAVPLTTTTGKNIKPQLAFSTDAATTSPKVKGPLRLTMKVRPRMTEQVDCVLAVVDDENYAPSKKVEDDLFALEEGGTYLVENDPEMDSYYVDVERVETDYGKSDDWGGGDDSARGIAKKARVRFVRWPTVSTE